MKWKWPGLFLPLILILVSVIFSPVTGKDFTYYLKAYQSAATYEVKVSSLESALSAWNESIGKEKKDLAEQHLNKLHYNEAVRFYRKNEYQRALIIFLKVGAAYWPLATINYIALCHERLNNPDKAIEALQNALYVKESADDKKGQVYLNLIRIAYHEHRWELIISVADDFYQYYKGNNAPSLDWYKYILVQGFYKVVKKVLESGFDNRQVRFYLNKYGK